MGHDDDAELGPGAPHLLDPPGDDAQGVDVEARVGLVQDGEVRLEHGHLEDLVALLLAAGEALVEIAAGEGGVHVEALHPLRESHPDLEHGHLGAPAGRHGLAEELRDGHAGDLLGVLEGEEHPRPGPGIGRPGRDVLALEQDPALGDPVAGVAGEGVGEGGLARAVGAHEGVQLARAHDEVDAAEDLVALDLHVQVLDQKHRTGAVAGLRGGSRGQGLVLESRGRIRHALHPRRHVGLTLRP